MTRNPVNRIRWIEALVHALCGALIVSIAGPPARAQETPGQPPADSRGKQKLTITVPTEGEYFVRFLPSSDAAEPNPLPIRFLDRKTTIEYDLQQIGKAARIAVDDAKTGDTAIRPLIGEGAPLGGTLDLRKADFDHVRQMDVLVSYKGDPVASARVTLTPRTGKPVTRVLDPARKGVAEFEDVPMGRARIAVVYGDNLTQTQELDIVSDREPGVLLVTVPVSSAVPVIEGARKADDADTERGTRAEPGEQPSSTVPTAPVSLDKAGIEVSKPSEADPSGTPWSPQQAPPPVVADPTACPFCGEKRDPSGGCACSQLPAGVSGAGASFGAPVSAQPRFVGTVGVYAGSVFPIGSGVTIGREVSNGIALPNDNTVSRRHASLRVEPDGIVVTDENSSNGVYVNGIRISGSAPVRPGDEVQIGNTRFRLEV